MNKMQMEKEVKTLKKRVIRLESKALKRERFLSAVLHTMCDHLPRLKELAPDLLHEINEGIEETMRKIEEQGE